MATKTRTLEAIEAEIAETKAALKDVHGTQTEVYARIVGYYRAVRNWNKGKRDEFDHRKMFVYDDPVNYTVSEETNTCACSSVEQTAPANTIAMPSANENALHYEFFMRRTCPNCPPVKNYMASVTIDGVQIDVDTEEGLKEAAAKGVFAAPTVIFYDAKNNEVGRAHNVEELSSILEPVAEAV
ncbi:MAG: hypothetical protein IJS09_00620 [Treponema sp.]|nr:hypothetical protein [Treponema sp.]